MQIRINLFGGCWLLISLCTYTGVYGYLIGSHKSPDVMIMIIIMSSMPAYKSSKLHNSK